MTTLIESQELSEEKHPIFTGEYAIYTPPTDKMINTIGDWIDQKLSGGYIYGPSRFGKSRGVKWFLKRVLEDRFSKLIPLVIWVRPDGRRVEGEFWNYLLLATYFSFAEPFKPKKKNEARFLFKQQLITMASKARGNYIIILIDEAQAVTLSEWQWLLGLQNELDYEGFRLSVFSIGSHQMMYQPDYIARTGNAHIAARFFVQDARFYGIRNVDELDFVLKGYDLDSEWPLGSGTSYLKYFAPSAFESGKRLSNHTQMIWDAFIAQLPGFFNRGKIKLQPELPMKHVALLIEKILIMLSNGSDWDEIVSFEYVTNLIEQHRFTAHLTLVSGKDE